MSEVERNYDHQKTYLDNLKKKNVVRHAILVPAESRDKFAALAKTLRCNQGDLLVAIVTLTDKVPAVVEALKSHIQVKVPAKEEAAAARAQKRRALEIVRALPPERLEALTKWVDALPEPEVKA